MSDAHVVINGVPVDRASASVSIFDRGFQYGDGLFETIAFVRGEPLFWDLHTRRMALGAGVLGIPMPSAEVWEADMRVATHGADERCVLKLTLTRGVSGRGYAAPLPQLPTRIVYTSPWPEYPAVYWENGVDLVTCHTVQLGGASFTTVKSLNRLNQVLARAELPEGVADGLLVDGDGMLREGTFTNVMWMRRGRAQTPDLTSHGIAGVMRHAIVERLREIGIPTDAVHVPPQNVLLADECFVCNSVIGVWPVRSIDGRPLAGGPGRVTGELLKWISAIGLRALA